MCLIQLSERSNASVLQIIVKRSIYLSPYVCLQLELVSNPPRGNVDVCWKNAKTMEIGFSDETGYLPVPQFSICRFVCSCQTAR